MLIIFKNATLNFEKTQVIDRKSSAGKKQPGTQLCSAPRHGAWGRMGIRFYFSLI
jgi:hypothetical protein